MITDVKTVLESMRHRGEQCMVNEAPWTTMDHKDSTK